MTVRAVVELSEALHARPANLLVRMASGFAASVRIERRGCGADAKRILDVLALGAKCGDRVELVAEGEDAQQAVDGLRALVERRFDGDLVPECAEGGAAGIAIGRAVVLDSLPSEVSGRLTPAEERSRLEVAAARVQKELNALVASLPPGEKELFLPETTIVEAILSRAIERVEQGRSAEMAVRELTADAATDLIVDARARLVSALAGGALFGTLDDATLGDVVLVTGALLPSLVALAPASVVGIVAARQDEQTGRAAQSTSHAAILARGRGIPLAFVPEHVTQAVSDGEWVVIDATEHDARVWVEPSQELVEDARARRAAWLAARTTLDAAASAPLDHLDVAVRANVGSLDDEVPPGAEGVGLVRTELLHAAWREAPDEADQARSLAFVAKAARRGPIVARLFDAGGDKPLSWLPPPASEQGARGIGLLLRHPSVLRTQLAAMARVRGDYDLRVLIPLTRSAADVRAVRELADRRLTVGAMIETPAAADEAASIAAAADFVCIGTNDLTAALGDDEPPLGRRVLATIERIVRGAEAARRQVTVCGELAGDPRGARVLVGLGVSALSVSPPKVAAVKAVLRETTRESCVREARGLLGLG